MTFGVDHIISGVAINIIAVGATRYLSSRFFLGREDGGRSGYVSTGPFMGLPRPFAGLVRVPR